MLDDVRENQKRRGRVLNADAKDSSHYIMLRCLLMLFLVSVVGYFQVLSYDVLMHELDVVNVRELEDFLINECMYVVGII